MSNTDLEQFSISFSVLSVLDWLDVLRTLRACSPWYNRNGWLGVKHQVTTIPSVPSSKCLFQFWSIFKRLTISTVVAWDPKLSFLTFPIVTTAKVTVVAQMLMLLHVLTEMLSVYCHLQRGWWSAANIYSSARCGGQAVYRMIKWKLCIHMDAV